MLRKRSSKTMCLVCAAALTVAFGGCGKKKETASAAEEVEKIILPVKAASAQKRDVTRALNFSGNIDAFRRAAIAPAVAGSRVMRIHVEEGQTVKEGQLLATMEDYQLQQSASQLAQLQAQLAQVETDFGRTTTLHSRGSVTQQQYDQAKAGYESAKAGYNAARAGFNSLKKSIELRAPFSGTIIGRHFNEGEVYNGGPGFDGVAAIVSVAQLERMKIEVMVPEQDFVRLKTGQIAHVRTDAFPDTVFEGRVFTVNPSLNSITRTSRVAIEIINKKQQLKPGMFARVQVITETHKNVLAVPATAIIRRDGQTYVFTVEKDTAPFVTKPKLVPVETGMVTDTYAEIISGVAEGVVVLTDNNVSLSENTAVRVTEIR